MFHANGKQILTATRLTCGEAGGKMPTLWRNLAKLAQAYPSYRVVSRSIGPSWPQCWPQIGGIIGRSVWENVVNRR
jgi:hypothetical protein